MTFTIVRQVTAAPRMVAYVCVGGLLLAGWGFVIHIEAGQLLAALCGPSTSPWTVADMLLVFVMWAAMSLAMMMPTAFPMVSVYSDISEAAAAKGLHVPSPLILVAGYLIVWLGFSAAAVVAQSALRGAGPWAWHPAVLGFLLIGAGAYQFTAYKRACLTKCQRPMPYFMANWSDRHLDVFWMGLSQGAACLGCCWAMMALGLFSGFMNPLWMGAAAILILAERVWPQPKAITYGLGMGLVGAGVLQLIFAWEVNRAIW